MKNNYLLPYLLITLGASSLTATGAERHWDPSNTSLVRSLYSEALSSSYEAANPYELTPEEERQVDSILEEHGINRNEDGSVPLEAFPFLPTKILEKEHKSNHWDLKNDKDSLTASSVISIKAAQETIAKELEKRKGQTQ